MPRTKKAIAEETINPDIPAPAPIKRDTKNIVIKPIDKEVIRITIEGDKGCDMILNKMTEESIKEIIEDQTDNKTGGKKKKKPINMWQRLIQGLHLYGEALKNCPYREPDGTLQHTEECYYWLLANANVGYNASGIKKGLCEAAIRVLGESKSTIINANLQVSPEYADLVPIKFGETDIDEAIITNWKGNAFLTYRTIFRNWSSTFEVEYLPTNLSLEQVIAMFNAMGFAGGLGAHRVGLKGGTNGKFHVSHVEIIREAAA